MDYSATEIRVTPRKLLRSILENAEDTVLISPQTKLNFKTPTKSPYQAFKSPSSNLIHSPVSESDRVDKELKKIENAIENCEKHLIAREKEEKSWKEKVMTVLHENNISNREDLEALNKIKNFCQEKEQAKIEIMNLEESIMERKKEIQEAEINLETIQQEINQLKLESKKLGNYRDTTNNDYKISSNNRKKNNSFFSFGYFAISNSNFILFYCLILFLFTLLIFINSFSILYNSKYNHNYSSFINEIHKTNHQNIQQNNLFLTILNFLFSPLFKNSGDSNLNLSPT